MTKIVNNGSLQNLHISLLKLSLAGGIASLSKYSFIRQKMSSAMPVRPWKYGVLTSGSTQVNIKLLANPEMLIKYQNVSRTYLRRLGLAELD